MHDLPVDTSDRTEQRKFGFLMAAAIIVLGLARWGFHVWRGHEAGFPSWFFIVAGVFAGFAIVAPGLLRPVFIVWMRFALLVNWVVTHLLLTIAYLFMITPTRFLMRIFGDDPLKRAYLPDADTYWEEPDDQPEDIEAYKNQF